MSLPPDVVEGKFEVLHKISEGGMGEVYKVRHVLLDQPFVIKVIRPQLGDDDHLKQRFHREARAASRLRTHPNVAGVHDFSIGSDGTAYIVMEFIDGSTLKEILAKSGPPPLPLTLEIAHQSLQALGFLHQQGYVHRDVSPDNLMLTTSFDGKPLVKLIDLGLTKRLEASADLTTAGAFLGKVRYSAPEQLKNETVDARSDLYSFGVMLYELLTGRRPIEGEEFTALLAGHLFRPPLDFEEADPEGRVPTELRRIVMKTLGKEPENRFPDAEELTRALEPLRQPASIAGRDLERTIDLARPEPPPEPPAPTPEPPQASASLPATGALKTGPAADAAPADRAARHRPALGRPRPLWMAAAAAGVLAAGALWYASGGGSPRFVEVPPAQASYRLALEAIAREDWPAAGEHLDQALALDPQEKASPQWANPEWDGPYLPAYYRGLVHFKRFTCPLAVREWQRSEEMGAIQATSLHQELLVHRGECWRDVETDLSAIETSLEEVSAVAAVLASFVEDPALAVPSGVEQDVRRSLEACDELGQRLESARQSQDFGAVPEIEDDLFDLKSEIDRLERAVQGSS